MQRRVAIILGTRPEAIKLIPVYLELKKSEKIKPILISTGQHESMLSQVFDLFNVKPDHRLSVMSNKQTLSKLTGNLFLQLGTLFENESFNAVMVQGDTTSATVGSMIGFYHQKKVIHIEAGLRTYDKWSPFPEEVNRRIIGLVGDIHFAPTEKAKEVLLSEKSENVFMVGNTVIDSLLLTETIVDQNESHYLSRFKDVFNPKKKTVLVTGHRRENFGKGFEDICKALLTLSQKYSDLDFIYPVHLNPSVKVPVEKLLKGNNNIKLVDPLPYDELIFLMKRSYLILTDSGGIQEEAPSFDIPLIVMRNETERPEGIDAGCAVLVGTDTNKIISKFTELIENSDTYNEMRMVTNPYGDGRSSERIRRILDDKL